MLKAHLDTLESILLATSRVVENAGHKLHKGTPREAFIRDFLRLHLSENVGIGSGEIFDHESKPDDFRNQLDIVLYHRGFPRLDFGAGINAFLCEAAIAQLEIKSIVDRAALLQAVRATRNVKALERTRDHALMPNIYSYVVGYSGPASMSTIDRWLMEIHEAEGIELPTLAADISERVRTPSPSLDVVVVLGKGFFYYDTSPIGLLDEKIRRKRPETKWVWVNEETGNLLFLFLHLTQIIGNSLQFNINLSKYLRNIAIQQVRFSSGKRPKRSTESGKRGRRN